MKVVIIGGGIAGMTMGSFLQEREIEVVICEKLDGAHDRGHAFLIHTEALSILTALDTAAKALPGMMVSRFSLRRPLGEEVKNVALDSWICMKRCELTAYLHSLLAPGTVKGGRVFSHFVHEAGKVVGAAFVNGEVEYGDLFIGADGGNSRVREAIFPPVAFTPVIVKEVVGVCRDKELARRYAHTFVKFQDARRGLAVGIIPTHDDECVWFMQYDPTIADVADDSHEALRAFCMGVMEGFPAVVKNMLSANDYSKTYIWNTRDFDLLPGFHQGNVVLLGDAAHLTLPFTSAGTTNAIIGAKVLADCLEKAGVGKNQRGDHEAAFQEYYRQRSVVIAKHILLGRQLRAAFLSPLGKEESPLPFLAASSHGGDRIQVHYFTDPICSTCWIIQPLWKKLHLEYGRYLDIRYVMGGLLPSWKDCKGKIQSPSDAALHWKEVADFYKMPIDAGVWTEDPLSSSFPPSIAFKAAQLQDGQKALLFLRRLREMIFLEKKNIMKWRFLEMAALEVGLDTVRFRRDYGCDARTAFERDLELARQFEVASFPTLIFTSATGKTVRLKGYQHYRDFEEAVLELAPHAVKEEINREPESLFRYFPTMVDEEFALLSNMVRKDARKVLQDLSQRGYIEKVESQHGVLWKMRES